MAGEKKKKKWSTVWTFSSGRLRGGSDREKKPVSESKGKGEKKKKKGAECLEMLGERGDNIEVRQTSLILAFAEVRSSQDSLANRVQAIEERSIGTGTVVGKN